MNDDRAGEALRSLVSLPWITQQHFVVMLQARRVDVNMTFISFSNGNGSAFGNSLDSGWIFFRKRPCDILSIPARCTKTIAVGNGVAKTGRDLVFGTTARLSDLSMPLTGEVQRSPEQSARQPTAMSGKFARRAYSRRALDCEPSVRPSAAADSEERQICTTCLFAESVGLCLCFLPSCAMYKDNAVANGVAEMRRDSVFMTTARLSDLSMPLKGEVRLSPEQSARQPIARSGKFARRAYSRRALDCEKMTVLCFLPTWSTLLFERGLGEEGRFDVARSETPKTSCQNHKQQLLRPHSGPSKAAHMDTRTTQ